MKKADKYLIIGILIVAAISFLGIKIFMNGFAGKILITRDGKLYKEVELDKNQTIIIEVPGEEGSNTLEIKNGYAKMIDSSCPDHLCEKQHRISKKGETIICLPNKVVVEAKSKEEPDIDGVAK